jgi:hypothetical protein
LPTPRAAAEIPGGQGAEVLDGQAAVLTTEGEDVSAQFLDGARQALALVQQHGIRIAVLKANSPSCGNLLTYDGTFSGVKVSGEGVTAALLKRHGVQVFSELELAEAAAALAALNRPVGAGLSDRRIAAMVVNDNACELGKRGALESSRTSSRLRHCFSVTPASAPNHFADSAAKPPIGLDPLQRTFQAGVKCRITLLKRNRQLRASLSASLRSAIAPAPLAVALLLRDQLRIGRL